MTEHSVGDWARHVRLATHEATSLLHDAADGDWALPAGDLKWSCWTTGVHIAEDLFAYAAQVAGLPQTGYLPFELLVPPTTHPAEVVSLIDAGGEMLAATVAQADLSSRSFHPWGMTDPSGFAAMGMTEALVHAYDIGQGLGLTWRPGDDGAGMAVARLFPNAPEWPVAGERLLWCTGRIALGAHARRPPNWRWEATPR